MPVAEKRRRDRRQRSKEVSSWLVLRWAWDVSKVDGAGCFSLPVYGWACDGVILRQRELEQQN